MLQDFIVPLPQTAEKKETENEPSLYLKRPLVIMADSPQVCLFFTNPRKLIWKYYMEPENVPQTAKGETSTNYHVSFQGSFFTSFFFQEIQKENQKKKLEQHTIRRPLGQFLCGLRNLNSCNLFLKWMNKGRSFFVMLIQEIFPRMTEREGGKSMSNLGMFDPFKPYHFWADISFLLDEGCTFLVLHVMGFTRMVMNGLLLLIVFQVGGKWDAYKCKHIYIYVYV